MAVEFDPAAIRALATILSDTGLTEIVVTAQKYNSTVQNTPISMSAISGDQLQAAGITSVEELAHEIPGLSMRSAGPICRMPCQCAWDRSLALMPRLLNAMPGASSAPPKACGGWGSVAQPSGPG